MQTYGNMKVKSIDKSGIATVICHCGDAFFVSGLVFEDKTNVLTNARPGGAVIVDGLPIRCSGCKCRWQTSGFPKKPLELPELPTEWKFFVMYVTLKGDAEEQKAILGVGVTLFDFTTQGVLGLLKSEGDRVKHYRIEEIPFEEYERITDEVQEKRRSEFSLGEFLGSLLGG